MFKKYKSIQLVEEKEKEIVVKAIYMDTENVVEAIALLAENPQYDKITIHDTNNLIFTLDREADFDKAMEIWNKADKDVRVENSRKHKEWLENTPEGKKKLEDIKRAEEYRIKDFKELYKSINKLPYTDLTSESTPLNKAIDFAKDLMVIFSKCDELELDLQEQDIFRSLLISKGACKYNEAHRKFKSRVKTTPGESLTQQGTLDFPLSAMTTVIIGNPNVGLMIMADGGERSWCMEWVNAQSKDFVNNEQEDEKDIELI